MLLCCVLNKLNYGIKYHKTTLQSFDIPTPQGIPSSGVDPIVLYLTSDIETRAEIITSHPDVAEALQRVARLRREIGGVADDGAVGAGHADPDTVRPATSASR